MPPIGVERLFVTLRRSLVGIDTLPTLSILGVVAGLLTGLVMALFRWLLDAAAWLLRGQDAESFENLSTATYLLMPFGGALLLGLAFNRLPPASRRLGVVHVMEGLANHGGRLPLRDAWRQFVGTLVGLTAGLSGGYEGPVVHIGAAASSQLGEWCRLPPQSVRTLVACGAAGAIGASFNTPLAGVVFAMEVVLMEYTISGFLPVILATVTATMVNRWAFGDAMAFAVPETKLHSLLEVPYIMLAGLAVGVVGGIFITLVKVCQEFEAWPFWARAAAAGALTGCLALVTPAVLGPGQDTVNEALLGNLAWTALLVILVTKILASAACVGAGLPVGMIGPTLVIGAVAGGLLGVAGNALVPGEASAPALYVMLGMAAMMAAVLQAPLAALVAVLELTGNPNIILPAMFIIVVAMLTVRQVFKQRSVFLTTLESLGIQYPPPNEDRDRA